MLNQLNLDRKRKQKWKNVAEATKIWYIKTENNTFFISLQETTYQRRNYNLCRKHVNHEKPKTFHNPICDLANVRQ